MADRLPQGWIEALPKVRGRILPNAPLGRQSWFGAGGTAEVLFRPEDEQDLAAFLHGLPDGVPVTVVGAGSNLLVRDGGVPGVVVRLGGAFAEVKVLGDCRVSAGAAALDTTVAMVCLEHGIGGCAFLSGVPGTIGGGLRMNAGAYQREMKDIVVEAMAMDRAGNRHVLRNAEMGFGYRQCGVPQDWIFLQAVLQGQAEDPATLAQAMHAIREQRGMDQPVHVRTGGSTFANPEGGVRAWELIDRAGCRGLRIGGAQVSEKHCNFLLNTGTATAADLERLGEEVRRRVRETSGIDLKWEIRRIGVPLAEGAKE